MPPTNAVVPTTKREYAVANTVAVKETKTTATNPKKTTATAASKGTKYHTVKRGETLTAIAAKHKVTVKQLQDWNKVTPKTLQAGKKLRVSK